MGQPCCSSEEAWSPQGASWPGSAVSPHSSMYISDQDDEDMDYCGRKQVSTLINTAFTSNPPIGIQYNVINRLDPGVRSYQRIGAAVRMKHLRIRGFVYWGNSVTNPESDYIRFMVIYAMLPYPGIVFAPPEEILQDRLYDGTVVVAGPRTPMNRDYANRFKVIADETMTITIGNGSLTNLNKSNLSMDMDFELDLQANYDPTLPDPVIGQLAVLCVSENNRNWRTKVTCTVEYDDA